MKNVYVVMHEHVYDDEDGDIKMVGIYSSEAKAKEAVEMLKERPGFSAAPDGFLIDVYQLDETHWLEGYSLHRSE
ncbi:DUF7336 domain-containing protein [Algicola sagamiensis]|uniref:DUF7336 domain-containing protein n=1 Tax=Algicola sagamiensis TaxID=163869 RepID=UPI0003812C76|nr:hypothetical protein [Algicola sagamiensis]